MIPNHRPLLPAVALALASLCAAGCDPSPPVTNPSAPSSPANPPAGGGAGATSPAAATSR